MAINYVTTILKVAVHRDTENPVFGEGNTYVSIDDEAGGPFIVIEQDMSDFHNQHENKIRLDFQELEEITKAAKMLMHQMYIEKESMK